MTLLSPNVRIDRELFDALTDPSRINDYPVDSRAYGRIDVSLRAYWHALFDSCPELLELSGPDGMSIFRPFMAFAREKELCFSWTYYLWVYEWLKQSEFRSRLTDENRVSLMGASAARWAIRDRGPDCGLIIGRGGAPTLVVGWKCHTVHTGRQVELIEPEEPLPAPKETFGYFTVSDFDIDLFPGWRSIPL